MNINFCSKRVYEPLVLLGVSSLLFLLFSLRFTLSFDVFKGSSCLNATALLVDTWDKDISRNELIGFHFPVEGDKTFKKGLPFLKIARGVPGDIIDVTPTITKTMDRTIKLDLTRVANKLNIDLKTISRRVTLGDGQYFAMGETINSYDSRFWGKINEENIIGKGYVIF
jgi:hypothetical protein